ncbi:unnamed protein product [Boreogadus saida]
MVKSLYQLDSVDFTAPRVVLDPPDLPPTGSEGLHVLTHPPGSGFNSPVNTGRRRARLISMRSCHASSVLAGGEGLPVAASRPEEASAGVVTRTRTQTNKQRANSAALGQVGHRAPRFCFCGSRGAIWTTDSVLPALLYLTSCVGSVSRLCRVFSVRRRGFTFCFCHFAISAQH